MSNDKTWDEYFTRGGWDPWDELKVFNGGYSSAVDQDAINVLRGIQALQYNTDIAKALNLSQSHVELFQYLFCSADWCDYGTSPRGCFPNHDIDFDVLLEKWVTYYRAKWNEEPALHSFSSDRRKM